ncbi:MAG: hypothetical protein KF686_10305 [Ramlibacter sp.]|nr:hypothetical protein [Ramlibacter sp.]
MNPPPVIILQMGQQALRVVEQASGTVHTLPLGTQAWGAQAFRHNPPTPGELEEAIMVVEDHVMPLLRRLPPGGDLQTQDSAVLELARRAGLAGPRPVELPIDQVERLFEQLSAVALGRPVASGGVPTDAAFSAAVLILREFMHHLGFTRLTVIP